MVLRDKRAKHKKMKHNKPQIAHFKRIKTKT